MELHAGPATVVRLQASVAGSQGPLRVAAQVELAWHLRQRDSPQALAAADAAQAAIALTGDGDEARRLRRRLALTRCEVAALQGRLHDAESALRDAMAQADASPEERGDQALAEAQLAKAAGQRERELAAYRRAVDALSGSADAQRRAMAAAWLAYEQAFSTPEDEPPAAPARHDDPAVDALRLAARALRLSRREPARAAELFLQASEQAQRAGLQRHAVICTVNAGAALQGLGEFEQAAACFDIAETVARSAGWPTLLGVVQTRLGGYFAARARLEEAREVLVLAVAAFSAIPDSLNRANACGELALVLVRMGRAVEAVAPMADANRIYRLTRSTDNLALNLIEQGRLYGSLGRVDEALSSIREAQAVVDAHGLHAMQPAIHLAWAEIHRRHRVPGTTPHDDAPTAALHHAEAALREGLAIAGWRPPSAILKALADDWAAAGHADRAFVHARHALSLLEDELALERGRVVELLPLRSAQVPPPTDESGLWRPALPGTDGRTPRARLLTPKELQILGLLARRYTNKEIAIALSLTGETVKWHLKKVFAKLAVGTRRGAVDKARALGVLGYDVAP